jgi:hypothetical protein
MLKNSFYDRKISFNITTYDDDRMTDVRRKLNLEQSEFIRRAIRAFTVHHMAEIFRQEYEGDA